MARQLSISDGTTTISLISLTGVMLEAQTGRSKITEEELLGEENFFAETLTLSVFGSSVDNLSTNSAAFLALLRKAVRYKRDKTQRKKVYLIEQLTGETNPRYAQIVAVPTLEHPPLFRNASELDYTLEKVGVSIIRTAFLSQIPGTLPATPITLTASDGAASPTQVFVSNHRDTTDLTHIYVYDASGTSFSGNLVADPDFQLFPAAPAANDILYFGSTAGYPKNIAIPVGTAGSYVMTIEIGYCKGGGAPSWTALVEGTDLTRFPTGTSSNIFKSIAEWMISSIPPTDAALATINGVSAFWVYVKITAYTSCAAVPATNALCYLQSTPHVEIPAAAIGGDLPPVILQRLLFPTGGSATPNFGSTSRIIAGAKSDIDSALTKFVSHLNAGGVGNIAECTTTQGTDATDTADNRSPGGKSCVITFGTSTTMVVRVTFTLDDMLPYWKGDYRVFARVKQVGGANGDCRIKLRAMLESSTAGYPVRDGNTVALQGHDVGQELVDLTPIDTLSLPFTEIASQDVMATDVVLQVLAERLTGAATLRIYDLILIPVDEWAVDLMDPDIDVTSGGSALKGDNALDVDEGLIAYRAIKHRISGSSFWNQDTWTRAGLRNAIQPATKTRIYYVLAHYPTTFGAGPMIGDAGMMMAAKIYAANRYLLMRGGG